ncbi:MAG: hypothetical protein ABTQ25_14115 [Nitrosomonas ureae]
MYLKIAGKRFDAGLRKGEKYDPYFAHQYLDSDFNAITAAKIISQSLAELDV